jgi:2-dehydro-3-deoxygalactonokinase
MGLSHNMIKSEHQQLLGIDWGTSNRRAYLIERGGRCLASRADDQGMLAARGNFGASLAALLREMQVGDGVPVVMSGMVGSANGWQEVPYLDSTVALERLPSELVALRDHGLGRECLIVPGYCSRTDGIDVMRGEETQLLGAVASGRRDGWVVLPGTHSKWVLLRDGVVARLATYMTGELFAMLAAGGTLAALMQDDSAEPGPFLAGLDEAMRGQPLSHTLFGARARVVTGAMPAAHTRAYVSGLLIGTEFAGAQASEAGGVVSIIASAALSQRYRDAAAHVGLQADVLDPDQVYLAALAKFF